MASGPRERSTVAARRQRAASERPAAVRPGPVPPNQALTRTARMKGQKFSRPIDPRTPKVTSRAKPIAAAERAYHFSDERWVSIFRWLRCREAVWKRIDADPMPQSGRWRTEDQGATAEHPARTAFLCSIRRLVRPERLMTGSGTSHPSPESGDAS